METGPGFVLNFTNVTASIKLIALLTHSCTWLLHKGVVTLAKFGQNSSIVNRIAMHEAPFTQSLLSNQAGLLWSMQQINVTKLNPMQNLRGEFFHSPFRDQR